jgi:uncharacterized protein YjbJ (UPF0337 family)
MQRALEARHLQRRRKKMADRDRDTGLQDHLEGTGDEVKGRAKQASGGLTGDRTQQGEGLLDETKGKAKDALGDVKDRLGEANDREADDRT